MHVIPSKLNLSRVHELTSTVHTQPLLTSTYPHLPYKVTSTETFILNVHINHVYTQPSSSDPHILFWIKQVDTD